MCGRAMLFGRRLGKSSKTRTVPWREHRTAAEELLDIHTRFGDLRPRAKLLCRRVGASSGVRESSLRCGGLSALHATGVEESKWTGKAGLRHRRLVKWEDEEEDGWSSRLRKRSSCNGGEDSLTPGEPPDEDRPPAESDEDDTPLARRPKRRRKNGKSRFQVSDEDDEAPEQVPVAADKVEERPLEPAEAGPAAKAQGVSDVKGSEVLEGCGRLNLVPAGVDGLTEGAEKATHGVGTSEKWTSPGKDTGPGGTSEKWTSSDKDTGPGSVVPEGRRCALCGETEVAKVETNNCGSTKSKPGLGRLLGPFSDKVGVAPVWVHQECAVWSPEVYFHGLGCLRNVRAALRRGRFLKCSRCRSPGATIGCRVRACPRVFHLPCARLSNCSFDPRRYLMSCSEHAHLFRKRMRDVFWDEEMARKSSADRREDKVENAEDEEFLRRERKRLHRDLAELAPVQLGGSSTAPAGTYEGWESVGGLKDVVQSLKEVVMLPLLYPEIFQKVGIVPPRGVLLHGHPGTGKTLVVRALLGACARGQQKIAYFARKGADCLGKYVGDAERQLRLLFQLAEQSQPSIIFFDEIDGLAPRRSRHQDQTQSSVVSTLLALMDGLNSRGSVVVIGATNRPDALDPALRRPGRFDREVYFPLPTAADRKAILAVQTRKWPTPPSERVLSVVSKATMGFAGADLQALCTQAAMVALKREASLAELLSVPDGQRTLPEVEVTDIDWKVALAQAPPPCSRRTLVNALSEMDISPLPYHLVPVLMEPIMELLVQLKTDGRFVLPTKMEKLLAETKKMNNRDGLQEVEDVLEEAGMISGLSNQLDGLDGTETENKSRNSMPARPWKQGNLRVLLTGSYKHGQSLVAASFLHAFQAFAQVYVLSIQTMIQAGSGDVSEGLVQVLSEARAVRSVVYMPNIDAWALENDGENDRSFSSALWNTFLQQASVLPSRVSMLFLATCELDQLELPLEIPNFFDRATAKAVPCASVRLHVLTNAATTEVIDRAAKSTCSDIEMWLKSRNQSTRVRASGVTSKAAFRQCPAVKAASDAGPSANGSVQSLRKPRTAVQDAVRNCGLQLLQCPQFMAVRQATRELTSGPSLTLENPYTGIWTIKEQPTGHSTSEKVVENNGRPQCTIPGNWQHTVGDVPGPSNINSEDDDKIDTVWGLEAVGLKACKGFYQAAWELVTDFHQVVTELRLKMDSKMRRGITRWRSCQLLAQATALQDVVECWAYELRRLESREKKRATSKVTEPASHSALSAQPIRGSKDSPDSGHSLEVEMQDGTVSEARWSQVDSEKLTGSLKQLIADFVESQMIEPAVEELHDLISKVSRLVFLELADADGCIQVLKLVDNVRKKLGLDGSASGSI